MKSTLNGRARASRVSSDSSARTHLKDAAASTRDSVLEMGGAAKDLARSEFENLSEQFKVMRDELLEKVSQKPMKSLLIAAGAGLVVGFLVRRSR